MLKEQMGAAEKGRKKFVEHVVEPNFDTVLYGFEAVESVFNPSLLELGREGGNGPHPFGDFLKILEGLEGASLKKLQGSMEKDKSLETIEALRSDQAKGFFFFFFFFFFF